MKWGKVFLSLLLLLVFSGTVVLAEGGEPPSVAVQQLSPEEIPPLGEGAVFSTVYVSPDPAGNQSFPTQVPACLTSSEPAYAVLASPVYPDTAGWSFCIHTPAASNQGISSQGCAYTEYVYYFEPCGSCGDGAQWVHTWRRIVDPCFGYTGPWEYLGKGCLPC